MGSPNVVTPLQYRSISTTGQYDQLLKALYLSAKQKVEEVTIPAVKAIAVEGNEPPASDQYRTAGACLYGVAYTLRMGLKFGRLPKPRRYFDYRVGALESLWWSTKGQSFEISNSRTLRWKAYLMVPDFVDQKLFRQAVTQAKAKEPRIPYDQVTLEQMKEGHAVQILHIGPYDKEAPTVDLLRRHMAENGFVMAGKHHEIYISDPRRTKPEKLKTVIRLPVKKRR